MAYHGVIIYARIYGWCYLMKNLVLSGQLTEKCEVNFEYRQRAAAGWNTWWWANVLAH